MRVLILAAGYGTRLYPLTQDTPKPLLPVADKPMINHLLDKVEPLSELREVVVVTNKKFYKHFSSWAKENRSFIVPINVVDDGTSSNEKRLGSIGDIKYILDHLHIHDDLFVLGGDNLFDYSLKDFLSFSQDRKPCVTVGLYDIEDLKAATKFGVVALDKSNKIVSFEEKPEKPPSTLIAMCAYYFPAASLTFIDDYLKETGKADKAGDYIHWLLGKSTVYGFKFEGKWYDIGSIETYQEAQEKFKP